MKTSILHLIPSFHQGGSEQQAVQLVGALSNRDDLEISVACLLGEGVLRNKLERLGYSVIPEFPLTSFYDLNMARQLKNCVHMIKTKRIEIVQTHDFYTNIFGTAAAVLARAPIRISAKRETGMRSRAQEFLERQAFRFSSAIVVNAEAVRCKLTDDGVDPEKLITIYNGIDVDQIEPSGSRKKLIDEFGGLPPSNAKFVTIVANMRSEVKNHRMFLRAAQTVKDAVPEARFVLAGEGELTEQLKAFAAELGLADSVLFTGRCANVGELLAASDVCVLASVSEGFSNSILEYMAAGKPVVATDVGGAAEAIIENETGFLVPSGDAAAMSMRIIELLSDPSIAAAFGERGRTVIEQKFSIASRAMQSVKLYEDLIRSRNGATVRISEVMATKE